MYYNAIYVAYKQQITGRWQSQYWCNHKTVKNKIMQQNSKRGIKQIIFTGILEWHLGKQPTNHTRIILGIKYKIGYHTALNKQKPTSHYKLLMEEIYR
jgi:hypothetical protein